MSTVSAASSAARQMPEKSQGQSTRSMAPDRPSTSKSERPSTIKSSKRSGDAGSDASSEEHDEYSDMKMSVKIVEAQDLIAADSEGTSDPFAKIIFDGHTKQTRTIKKSLYPVWNETFEYELHKSTSIILIQLFDYDFFGSNDFLGKVEIPVNSLALEAVHEGWYPLEPRVGYSDVVSGQLHLIISITPKQQVVQDTSGLEAHTWLDIDGFRAPGGERTTNTIRMYFASVYSDFQDEFAALRKDVFPKLADTCAAAGYTFQPVVMRHGLDEKSDRMYMTDPRVPLLHFREIEACRRLSPRANFFALMGERYGSSPLPLSLDRNEFMAVRGYIEGQDDLWQARELLEEWYLLNENEIPNRFVLQKGIGEVSPSAMPGSDAHKRWLEVEKTLYEAFREASADVLLPERVAKYNVSIFEQELTLGILYPQDAQDHSGCFMRTINALRVVSVNAAKFVDLSDRRGDVMTDLVKEVRPSQIDGDRRIALQSLKERVREKLGDRCFAHQAVWQGYQIGGDHIPLFVADTLSLLQRTISKEIKAHPRMAVIRQEVTSHLLQQRALIESAGKAKTGDTLPGLDTSLEEVSNYLKMKSDGSQRPLLVTGAPGSGLSTILASSHDWAKANLEKQAVLVYRNIGLTPNSSNGCSLLYGFLQQILTSYKVVGDDKMVFDLTLEEAADLPAADRGGTSDPFVTVTLGEQTLKTEVVQKSLSPVWDTQKVFENVTGQDVLVAKIWDYDIIGKNDFLGKVIIPLNTLEMNAPIDRWYPLMLKEDEVPVRNDTYKKTLHLQVFGAKNLMPGFRRMDLDPCITLKLVTHKPPKSEEDAEEANDSMHESNPDRSGEAAASMDPNNPRSEEEGQKGAGSGEEDVEAVEIVSDEMRTSTRTKTMDPVWDPHEDFEFPIGEGEKILALRGEVWDAGESSVKDPICIGTFDMDLTPIKEDGFGRGIDSWVSMEYADGIKGQGAQVHFVAYTLSELVVEEAEDNHEDIEGPRIRLKMMLTAGIEDQLLALDKAHVHSANIPSTYLDLAATFTSNLSLASSSKPLLLFIDNLQRLPAHDPAATMRWLPVSLPRNVHIVITFSKEETEEEEGGAGEEAGSGPLSHLVNRRPPPLRMKVALLEPITCKVFLNETIAGAKPQKNLNDVQRQTLLASFPLMVDPVLLKTVTRIGLDVPGYADIPPLKSLHAVVEYLVVSRAEYFLHGRCDMYATWRAVDLFTLLPWGLTERDLRDLVAGGTDGSTPLIVMKEIMDALQPFLMEVNVDGRIVYKLKHEMYRHCFRKMRSLGEAQAMACYADFLNVLKGRGEFNEGGLIDQRRSRLLPILLEAAQRYDEYEDHLADLGNVEMQLAESMYFDLQAHLTNAGPGTNGRLEDCLAFLEEFALLLHHRPRLVLQLALNMPDHSNVRKEARILSMRRRHAYFVALAKEIKKDDNKPLTAAERARKRSMATVAHGGEFEQLHATAMDWKKARPFLHWINKPQTRGQCKKVLKGSVGWISCCTYAARGRIILSFGVDRSFTAWSPVTTEVLREVGDKASRKFVVTSIAVCHDDHAMLIGGEDGTVALWSWTSLQQEEERAAKAERQDSDGGEGGSDVGEEEDVSDFPTETWLLKPHIKKVCGVAFVYGEDWKTSLFSEQKAVSASDDGDVRVFEVWSGRELANFIPSRVPVHALDTSPKGRPAVLATASGVAIKLWTIETRALRTSLYGHEKRITSVKFSPRHKYLMSGSWDKMLCLWYQVSPREWNLAIKLPGHVDAIRDIAWSPEGLIVASVSSDKSVKVWSINVPPKSQTDIPDSPSAVALANFSGHSETVRMIKFHPQGSLILTCSHDKDLRVWDTRVPIAKVPPAVHAKGITGVSTSVNGELAVTASIDDTVKLWDFRNGACRYQVHPRHSAVVSAVCFSSDGRLLYTGARDGTIKKWTVPTGNGVDEDGNEIEAEVECVAQAKAHRGGVGRLTAHPTSAFFLSCGEHDGKIIIWHGDKFLDVITFSAPPGLEILVAHFSLDGKFVISADVGGNVRLWHIEAAKQVLVRQIGKTSHISHCNFSSDGKFIASASPKDSNVVLWDAEKGLKEVAVLRGHSAPIAGLSFSFDGRFLCSIGEDRAAVVWQLKTLQSVSTFMLDYKPTAIYAGGAWPFVLIGDDSGNVYFLEFKPPVPLTDPEVAELEALKPSTDGNDPHGPRARHKQAPRIVREL